MSTGSAGLYLHIIHYGVPSLLVSAVTLSPHLCSSLPKMTCMDRLIMRTFCSFSPLQNSGCLVISAELYSIFTHKPYEFFNIRINVSELELQPGNLVVRSEAFKNEIPKHIHSVTLLKHYFWKAAQVWEVYKTVPDLAEVLLISAQEVEPVILTSWESAHLFFLNPYLM